MTESNPVLIALRRICDSIKAPPYATNSRQQLMVQQQAKSFSEYFPRGTPQHMKLTG